MLLAGEYRVRVTACTEGFNPGRRRESYKVSLHVIAASEGGSRVGETCTMITFMTPAGLAELKRFALHAAGFGPTREQGSTATAKALVEEGESQYDALDESFGYQGAILEASAGKGPANAPSLVGRIVDVTVSSGKPVINPQTGEPTGDCYRVYRWFSVPESEQR
jgi:hypothetical protein